MMEGCNLLNHCFSFHVLQAFHMHFILLLKPKDNPEKLNPFEIQYSGSKSKVIKEWYHNNWNEIFLNSWCKSNELQTKILIAFRFKVTGRNKNWPVKKVLSTFQTSISWKKMQKNHPQIYYPSRCTRKIQNKTHGVFTWSFHYLLGTFVCSINSFQTFTKCKTIICSQQLSSAAVEVVINHFKV